MLPQEGELRIDADEHLEREAERSTGRISRLWIQKSGRGDNPVQSMTAYSS